MTTNKYYDKVIIISISGYHFVTTYCIDKHSKGFNKIKYITLVAESSRDYTNSVAGLHFNLLTANIAYKKLPLSCVIIDRYSLLNLFISVLYTS